MSLPKLENWESTSRHLHQAARLLEAVRILTLEPQPLYLQLALTVLPNGLSSGTLPGGGELQLDFVGGLLRYAPAQGRSVSWSLADHTQATLFEAMAAGLAADRVIHLPPDHATRVGAFLAELAGRKAVPPREELTGAEPLALDRGTAAGYAAVQYGVFTGLARLRARLGGLTSPLVVWPHHFDLSGLWFAGNELDDWQPHLNFGFAPFSPGLPRPYLYAYAYPYPDGFAAPALPAPIRWHTEGWQGAVLAYDDISPDADLAATVESAAASIFAALLPLIKA